MRRAFVHAYNSVRLCGSQPGADDGKEHAGRVGVRSSTIARAGILRVDPVNVPALNRRARCYREGRIWIIFDMRTTVRHVIRMLANFRCNKATIGPGREAISGG